MAHISYWFKLSVLTGAALLETACYSPAYVPVEELKPQYAMNHASATYVVRPGDTLYAIAFLYDRNVQDLATHNHMTYPYNLKAGQQINIAHSGLRPKTKPVQPVFHRVLPKIYGRWLNPTSGKILPDTKGVKILGQAHQAVKAAQNGVVAYAGNGLPGYGQLILIKHSNDYLTAYAFNAAILVKEGQSVSAGQEIAQMGQLSQGVWGLHFEIRYRGTAVNPMNYI